MGENPSHFKGDPKRPVEEVSWDDAVAFCRKLSQKEGKKYRLRPEAEWEYARRAGTRTTWSFEDSRAELGKYAWWGANSGGTTHPVGQKKPNAWGLYDMHGNVWEGCSDWYNAEYCGKSRTTRVARIRVRSACCAEARAPAAAFPTPSGAQTAIPRCRARLLVGATTGFVLPGLLRLGPLRLRPLRASGASGRGISEFARRDS